jgi:hypothetical protein
MASDRLRRPAEDTGGKPMHAWILEECGGLCYYIYIAQGTGRRVG